MVGSEQKGPERCGKEFTGFTAKNACASETARRPQFRRRPGLGVFVFSAKTTPVKRVIV